MQIPKDVCLHNGVLQWREVGCADGYDIHHGKDSPESPFPIFVDSIVGGENTSFNIPISITNPMTLRVVAFATDKDGSIRSGKSDFPHRIPITKADEMQLIVDDDFKTLENWTKEFPYWGPEVVVNNELQIYEPDAFTLTDKGVTINAKKRGPNAWASGCLKGKIEQAYTGGLFKCRAQFDTVSGFLAAFWLLNKNYNSEFHQGINPEIDIFEHINGKTGQTYHHWNPDHNQISNLSDRLYGMNEYGLLWEPGEKLTWLINDIPVFSITENVSNEPMYPIFTLAVGGNWPISGGHILDPELQSAKMDIEWFRVWQ